MEAAAFPLPYPRGLGLVQVGGGGPKLDQKTATGHSFSARLFLEQHRGRKAVEICSLKLSIAEGDGDGDGNESKHPLPNHVDSAKHEFCRVLCPCSGA